MRDIPFHGEFSSADASALTELASRFSLYENGTNRRLTVGSNDDVIVHDIIYDYTGASARTVQIYDGENNAIGDGEKICETTLSQNEHSESHGHAFGFICQRGTYPKVKASGAGQVTVLICGVLMERVT